MSLSQLDHVVGESFMSTTSSVSIQTDLDRLRDRERGRGGERGKERQTDTRYAMTVGMEMVFATRLRQELINNSLVVKSRPSCDLVRRSWL